MIKYIWSSANNNQDKCNIVETIEYFDMINYCSNLPSCRLMFVTSMDKSDI